MSDFPDSGLLPGVSAGLGTGILGGSSRQRTRTRPDLCAEYGHPGCTYNPWHDVTACLCGERWQEGDRSSHIACCDGPLVEQIDP